jgi:predicted DsbA family dithiol-disulfide isomerase
MSAASTSPLTIDVIADVVCPWCYIGMRRLERALGLVAARHAQGGVAVRWHPFELNPALPPEGMDRGAYLEVKFGGAERAAQIYDGVRAAGETAGITFAFERIARQPNSRDANRLILWAQQRGDAAPLVERLFIAFFSEGRDLGDRAVLSAIAGEAGLDAAAARAMLDSNEGVDAVLASERRAVENGVGGVPFYIFNRSVAVAGAQEPQVLADAIAESVKYKAA